MVADGEHAPVTPHLIAELAALDPAGLDDSGRVATTCSPANFPAPVLVTLV